MQRLLADPLRVLGLTTVLMVVLPLSVHAEAVYTYTGDAFTTADPPYTTSDRLTGAFTLAVQLPPFSPLAPVNVVDYAFADGVATLTPANSVICNFEVATDGAGHIIDWTIGLRELVANPGDPQQTMNSDPFGDQVGFGPAMPNECDLLSLAASASVFTPGAWSDTLPAGTPTTYSYTGAMFSSADPPYTTNDRVTGSFDVADPLPPFPSLTDIAHAVDDYSFSDGVQVRTPANSEICFLRVVTDSGGHIVGWSISLREIPFMPSMPQQFMDSTTNGDLVGVAPADTTACDPLSATTVAMSTIAGTWVDPLPPTTPVRYDYTGQPFAFAQAPYTTSDRLSGSIDLPSALPPFLPSTNIRALLQGFSFSDGVQTRTPANSDVCRFDVATDGSGNIVAWTVGLREIPSTPGQPQFTIDSSRFGDLVGSGLAGAAPCSMIDLDIEASNMVAGTWSSPLPPATPTDYDYEGDPFTFAEPPYTVGGRLTGGISLPGALPANLPFTDVSGVLLDLSFVDGQQTRTLANSVVCRFEVATDAAGDIVQWRVSLRQSGVAIGDPQESVDSLADGTSNLDLVGSAPAGADPCGMLSLSPNAGADTAGTWTGDRLLPIPTLSEWALALLTLLIAATAILRLRAT